MVSSFPMIDGPLHPAPPCNDCGKFGAGAEFLTLINPEGGYGRARFLCCDDCMKSGRWDDWKAQHWPNWPEPRK